MAHHIERGTAPSPLAVGLMRVAVGLFAVSGLLAATAVQEASASPCGVVDHRPIYCDFFTKLDLDFLNDELDPPACWNVNAGAGFAGEQVAFKIYGLTDDARFYQEVTSEVKDIRFRFRGFRWHPRFRYDEHDGDPRWVLDLRRERLAGRTGTIVVTYRCKSPSVDYVTTFFLTILPPR